MSGQKAQPRTWPWTLPRSKVFLKDDSELVNLRITDLCEDQYASTPYTSATQARRALTIKPNSKTRIRIISIYSKKTISPLDITSSLLEHIIDEYNIHADFVDIVSSFGQDPNIAEGSSNNATIHTSETQSCELSYQMRYVEQNQRGGKDPWSLRHTGIYHHHGPKSYDLLILLHPVREPAIQTTISALEGDLSRRKQLCSNPFLLHAWLFSRYFDNWRWYYRYLGERFNEENNLAMVIKPERTEPSSSFLRVQRLRNTNDFILFSRACCAGNLDLLTRLTGANVDGLRALDDLEAQRSKMKGYIESADVLKGRVQNLIDLVGYTLTLHNQLEAAKIDTELRDLTEGLKRLTEDTVDDSATVKIITFVSTIYLPGSFIATMYGMNFFVFNTNKNRLEISDNFWIFIATWLPMTVVTGALIIFVQWIDARLKQKKFRWPWQMKSRKLSPPMEIALPEKIG